MKIKLKHYVYLQESNEYSLDESSTEAVQVYYKLSKKDRELFREKLFQIIPFGFLQPIAAAILMQELEDEN